MDGLQGNTVKSLRHHAHLTAQAPILGAALVRHFTDRCSTVAGLFKSRENRAVPCQGEE